MVVLKYNYKTKIQKADLRLLYTLFLFKCVIFIGFTGQTCWSLLRMNRWLIFNLRYAHTTFHRTTSLCNGNWLTEASYFYLHTIITHIVNDDVMYCVFILPAFCRVSLQLLVTTSLAHSCLAPNKTALISVKGTVTRKVDTMQRNNDPLQIVDQRPCSE